MWRFLFIAGVSVVLSAHSAAATQYDILYVKPDGLADWPCGTSIATACRHISTAVNNANVYNSIIIKVAQGSYSESIYITENLPADTSKQLTIEGGWNADFTSQTTNPQLTRLTSSTNNAVVTISAAIWKSIDLRLNNLAFTGLTDEQRYGIDVSVTQSTVDVTLEHCLLREFRGNAIHLYGNQSSLLTFTLHNSSIQGTFQRPADNPWAGGAVAADAYAGSTITMVMTGNTITGNQASSGGGLYLYADDGTLNATLKNNIIANNSAEQQGGAIFAVTGGNGAMDVQLTNNTISANTAIARARGLGLASFDTSTLSAAVKNDINWNNGIDISTQLYNTSTLTVRADYSLIGTVDTTDGGTYTNGTANLHSDPLLDASYHLSSGSPAKDAAICGHTLIFNDVTVYFRDAPYDDIDGDLRPGHGNKTGCDIGADEYSYFPWILFYPAFIRHQ